MAAQVGKESNAVQKTRLISGSARSPVVVWIFHHLQTLSFMAQLVTIYLQCRMGSDLWIADFLEKRMDYLYQSPGLRIHMTHSPWLQTAGHD